MLRLHVMYYVAKWRRRHPSFLMPMVKWQGLWKRMWVNGPYISSESRDKSQWMLALCLLLYPSNYFRNPTSLLLPVSVRPNLKLRLVIIHILQPKLNIFFTANMNYLHTEKKSLNFGTISRFWCLFREEQTDLKCPSTPFLHRFSVK